MLVALDVLAVALIVAGVALVSIPAAFVVAGVLIGLLSWSIDRAAHR